MFDTYELGTLSTIWNIKSETQMINLRHNGFPKSLFCFQWIDLIPLCQTLQCLLRTKKFTYITTVQFSKSGHWTLMQYYYLWYRPAVLYNNYVFGPVLHITFSFHVSLVSIILEWFFCLSVSFTSMTFLKSADCLFCRMPLNWVSLMVSLWLDLGYTFLQKYYERDGMSLVQFITRHVTPVCSIIGDVTLLFFS